MNDDSEVTRRSAMELALRFAAASAFFANGTTAWGFDEHDRHSAPPDPDLLRDYRPQFFAPEDFQALQAFTEILIPTDEFPGAREAHCAHFIDFVMQSSGEFPETQNAWRNAMKALRDTGFHTADAGRRLELVSEMARPETDPHAHHPAFAAFRLIKQQTAFAFYTSRAGLIETLDYKGNSYNLTFPPCQHPEHQTV